MKEVFSKHFWEDVKKTFEEARDNPAPEEKAVEKAVEKTPAVETPKGETEDASG